MTDWVLKAIEEEAMKRARIELQKEDYFWRFMDFDKEQVRVMVLNAIHKGCTPVMSGPEIHERTK